MRIHATPSGSGDTRSLPHVARTRDGLDAPEVPLGDGYSGDPGYGRRIAQYCGPGASRTTISYRHPGAVRVPRAFVQNKHDHRRSHRRRQPSWPPGRSARTDTRRWLVTKGPGHGLLGDLCRCHGPDHGYRPFGAFPPRPALPPSDPRRFRVRCGTVVIYHCGPGRASGIRPLSPWHERHQGAPQRGGRKRWHRMRRYLSTRRRPASCDRGPA